MRDVIVVGAGGGGAVIAKELAARGLDVLLLEAGPRFAHSEREWRHLDNDRHLNKLILGIIYLPRALVKVPSAPRRFDDLDARRTFP